MSNQHPMHVLFEKLLAGAPEVTGVDGKKVKAFTAQVAFIGNTVAGAIAAGPAEGTYMILTTGRDERTGMDIVLGRMFTPENVLYLDVMIGEGPRVKLAGS